MKILRTLSIVATLAALAVPAQAQTSSAKLQWDMFEAPSVASGFSYTYKIDTAAAVTLNHACLAQGSGSRCTAPVPNLSAGVHTITVTATSTLGSATSDPVNGTTPSKPTQVQIVITVTVP